MTSRGVNGASTGTLNARFIRCDGCRVNVPKEDMLALGQCTVCGHPYEAVTTGDGGGIEVATVAFDSTTTTGEQNPPRKRWARLTSQRGRPYYHNIETGEDQWETPADLEAYAAPDAFVPFKNDAVKKAVLREQMKLEATKRGVPVEVVAATQQRLQHEDKAADPFANMMRARASTGRTRKSLDEAVSPKEKAAVPAATEDDAKEPSMERACRLM